LDGHEQQLFIVAALKPYPVRVKELLSTLRRIDLLHYVGRKVTEAQVERWFQAWSEARLVDYDGKTFQCDTDLGAYVCRKAAETTLGDFLRQCPSLEREIWRDMCGGDSLAYWVRVSRFFANPHRTEHLVREWLSQGGQDCRLAALFGPADPFYLPQILRDWTALLPRLSCAGTQRFQEVAWHVEFYDALRNADRDQGIGLLLAEDRPRFADLVTSAQVCGLASSSEYQRFDYCARLLWGQHDEVKLRASRPDQSQNPVALSARGVLQLCDGDVAGCLEAFQAAHRLHKSKGLDYITRSWFGVFELLALLVNRDRVSLARAGSILSKLLGKSAAAQQVDDRMALVRLGVYYEFCTQQTLPVARFSSVPRETPLSIWLGAMTTIWMDAPVQIKASYVANCKAVHKDAKRSCAHWCVAEMEAVLRRLEDKSSCNEGPSPERRLVDLVVVKAPWELMLESLARFAEGNEPSSLRPPAPDLTTRVAWFVQHYGEHVLLEPRLQTKKGEGFSRGRTIALQRLSSPLDETLPLTAADRKIAAHIVAYSAYYGVTEYRFDERVALDLVGHPCVYDEEDESLHYDVKRGQIWLRCEQNEVGDNILRLDPSVSTALHQLGKEAEAIVRRHGSELIVFELTKELKRLSLLIGQEYRLPKEAAGQLATLLPALSSLVPTSGTLLGGTVGHSEPSDTLPVLRIKPRADALRVQLFVTPFGPEGPTETPGEGSELVADYRDGQSRQVRRNLNDERERGQQLLESLPSLSGGLDNYVWKIEGVADCLELIATLSSIDSSLGRVEWPEGQPFKLKQLREMKVNVSGGDASQWFELEGQLRLSDDSLLTVAELLTRLKQREGRFVQLKSGDYAELSEDALAKLQLLEAFRVRVDKDGDDAKVQVAPWLAFALPEEGDLLSPQASHEVWRNWRKRVAQVSSKQPNLPKGFKGELRDYQLAGYHWLYRMAELSLGVCLADDMGLGKTVQALAFLEYRATRKLASKHDAQPMLIVAPASVCPNWLAEAERFTQNLELRWHTGAERNLEGLSRKTVVVCTYDVLYRDRDALTQIVWDTVILDEAQQIKNAHTHRAKTAFALKANFRLAMSGTPIENHLGELWSLYRFLMPGLLGDQHEFVDRFRNPIENQKDDDRRRQLQALIRPFLLRRTKQQVLSELPARTELIRKIPLSESELALYEAIRLRGLESLKNPSKDKNQQRVRVLAELMRLRRACCHPRLVLDDSEIASSKLATLLELLAELRDAGHRALVFSQFVDHLALVREALDDDGVSYQYLDGATPMAERAKRVQAFQQGEGELFLISLRAGGTGLNLTAADYVLHLDPWWNPAVEDQASDRAHRIGQERPVTIYRLVAEGTIEEKLVLMHGRKRALAADILAETGERKHFDPDELMDLLRESAVSAQAGKATTRRRGRAE
jgi:SNF2 family DNA or RNA helicase